MLCPYDVIVIVAVIDIVVIIAVIDIIVIIMVIAMQSSGRKSVERCIPWR